MIGNALIRWSKTLVERIRNFLWSIKGAVDVEGGRSLKVEQLFVGFTRNNFCPSGAQVEKELKMAGEKKNAIWALLLSLLALIITFQQNYHNNQLLIKPNETVGLFVAVITYGTNPRHFVCFVPGTRIFLAKAVYMVLGSSPYTMYVSARKILALRATLCM